MKEIIQKKICMLGDFSVGKTSLIRRFVEDRFDDVYRSTIGVKISRKTVQLQDKEVKLLLWDLAGGDDYNHLTSGYLRGAAGVILVCDVTRKLSFDAFNIYTRQINEVKLQPCMIMLGNKADLTDQIEIRRERLQDKSNELGVPFFFTSAKTGDGVNQAFEELAKRMLKNDL